MTKKSISAKDYSLWDVMNNFIYNIPEYQRPYSWTENEAGTLWDDLVDFWCLNKENENSYFIGSIVLVKQSEESPEVEVIDGQQRLSTMSIILASLMDYSVSNNNDIKKCLWEEGIQHLNILGRSRINLRKKDSVFFENYIAKHDISELLKLDPKKLEDDAQRLIQNNAKIIRTKIDEFIKNFKNDAIDLFVSKILKSCFFVVVTTTNNESAFRIFSVLNDRGLSLLPSDILKAQILGGIHDDKRLYYTDKWEDIETDLGREAFNSLLSHIRMIYAHTKQQGTLVGEFKQFIIDKTANKEEILNNIIDPYAKSYNEILRKEYQNSVGAEEVNDLLEWLNRLDDSDWIPPVIYAFSKYSKDGAFIREFVNKIERLASYFYITSKTSNKRIERYGRILKAAQEDNLDELSACLELSSEEQNEFINVLSGDIYLMTPRKRKYIILRLDSFISDGGAKYKNSIMSIEHVLPQHPKDNSQWIKKWPEEKVRDYWLNKLANLVLLTRKKNSQAQNYDFIKKKKEYFCDKNGVTTYALTTDVIKENDWTPIIIANRQKRLLGLFATKWNLVANQGESDGDYNDFKMSSNEYIGELLLQNKLFEEINLFFMKNPQTKLPRLINRKDIKVGEFVRMAWHDLITSDFLTVDHIIKLCDVEISKKYTRRNLSFLLPVDGNYSKNTLDRYWKSKQYIESYKGNDYYVFSQWYPDEKKSKDAHKSDFLQLYLDLANNKL